MMNENNMMHGVPYHDQDVSGWLMSEKMNGCRAFWDGERMWTRGGKVIAIPEAMAAALPAGIRLDGEINAGRGQAAFEKARQAVQYGRFTPEIVYSVFDAPDAGGIFIARYTWLQNILPESGPAHYLRHDVCRTLDDACARMLEIQGVGGEGLVLRHPGNLHRAGRTEEILKLKEVPDLEDSLSTLR